MPYKTKGNRLVNEVTLGDGYPLSSNLKPLKVGGKTSPLEMATAYPDDSNSAKVKVVGDLEVTGKITGNDESADITGISFITQDAGVISHTSGAPAIGVQGDNGVTTSNPSTDVIQITATSASTSAKGVVELATSDETNKGTDTARAVTPDGLEDWTGSGNIVETGALNGGSISSGFGNIDIGSSTFDTTGNVSVGDLAVNGNDIEFDASASTVGIEAAAHDTVGSNLTISAGSTTAGTTSNIAGGNLILYGGQGKGTADGGYIDFQVAGATSSGSFLNSHATTMRINADGGNTPTIEIKAPRLSFSDSNNRAFSIAQELNVGVATGGTQEYRMIGTDLTDSASGGWDNIYLIDQKVDGTSKFNVKKNGNATFAGTVTSDNGVSGRFNCSSNYYINSRMGSVNTWYLANRTLSNPPVAGDWATWLFNYAAFTATSDVKLKKWAFCGELSSSVDWEFELWDLTIPSNGTAAASTAAKVGSTQSVSATANAIYTIGQDDLDYTVSAGHQLYLPIRYTSGSGTKYTYGTMTMEFTNG